MRKFLLLSIFLLMARSGSCGFPASINCGSEIMTDGTHIAHVSLGYFAGFMSNAIVQNSVGFFGNADLAYRTFLNSDHPFAVHPDVQLPTSVSLPSCDFLYTCFLGLYGPAYD